MNCPKCGKEIADNQKFCGYCGAKLDDIENIQDDNETTQETDEKPHGLNSLQKKIIIAVSCIILVLLTVFGIFQFIQYQKDIAPMEKSLNFGMGGNILLNISYKSKIHRVNLKAIFKDIKAEEWQVEYLQEYKKYCAEEKDVFVIKIKSGELLKATYSDLHIEKNKNPEIIYYIDNISLKDFVSIKESNITNENNITILVPQCFYVDKQSRDDVKAQYFNWKKQVEAQKEAERKQKEWQEKILSNCVYKTSSGVCFTTQVFEIEPIIEDNPKNPNFPIKNYWLGASDFCESKGYKLPSDDDLRSLFADILGVEINSGVNVKTEKYSTSTIPTNYEILKQIAPHGFDKYSSDNWDKAAFWEDKDFNNEKVYYREKIKDWGNDVTSQSFASKDSSYVKNVICVYNPNGKTYKSLLQIQKEEIAKYKKEKEKKEKQTQSEAENALF